MLVIINVKHKGLCDEKIIITIVTGTSEQLKLLGLVFVARGLWHYYIIIYTRNASTEEFNDVAPCLHFKSYIKFSSKHVLNLLVFHSTTKKKKSRFAYI